jgi:class 3 adenylate cyclase
VLLVGNYDRRVPAPLTRYAKTVDGLHIAYQVVGDGPYDLVYAPGWISNIECLWDMPDLGDFLRRLSRHARLIVFDRRGSGLSDRPPTDESLSLEVGMDDIRAVLDATRSERAILFGSEDGGVLCSLFAASYPTRTSALILFGVWMKYGKTPDYPWGWTEEQANEWWQLVEQHWGTTEFWERNSSLVSARIQQDPERVQAWARYARLSASPGAALAIERIDRGTDARAVLPTIRVPTLVMHRTDDNSEHVGQAHYISRQIAGSRLVELPGDEHAPYMGDTDAVLDEVNRFIAGIREEEAEFDRQLATVLFTDLVGSTEQAAAIGDRAWRDLVEPHHLAIRGLLARYRGTEVDTAGDGFFATFDGPARAVRCAGAIVHEVNALGLDVRAGVHTGEIETINGKVGGVAVNIGSRVAGVAGPNEIFVSSTVKDLTAGSGLMFESAGEYDLKGIPDPWRLYRVLNGAPRPVAA